MIYANFGGRKMKNFSKYGQYAVQMPFGTMNDAVHGGKNTAKCTMRVSKAAKKAPHDSEVLNVYTDYLVNVLKNIL